jgi:hypothetical protein
MHLHEAVTLGMGARQTQRLYARTQARTWPVMVDTPQLRPLNKMQLWENSVETSDFS